jgi:hypothetical protein
MRAVRTSRESGQTMIEFGIFCTVLFMLTLGLVDVGRGFFQYNAVASIARYGARWGSVVGGECSPNGNLDKGKSTNDWCNQLGAVSDTTTPFFQQNGNIPLQTNGGTCPNDYDPSMPSTYYTASAFSGTAPTTIVATMVHKLDTDASSVSKTVGLLAPGLDLSLLHICIELPESWRGGTYEPVVGDHVGVFIYYPFHPVGPFFGGTLKLNSESEYVIE